MTIKEVKRITKILAKDFGVKVRRVYEMPNTDRRFGLCSDDKSIGIRILKYKSSKVLKNSTILDTICHELAHLVVWNHGRKHRTVLRLMLCRAYELMRLYQSSPYH